MHFRLGNQGAFLTCGLRDGATSETEVEDLDSDFKSHHYTIVDLIEEGAMDAKQTTLDEHDDRVTDLSIRLQQLITR